MEEYKWDVKNEHITVRFVKSCEITYCTISVRSDNRKIKHYHGGTVYNPADIYNEQTGKFLAFKKALSQRWEEKYWRLPGFMWKDYYRVWSHYLAATMDGKVISFDDYLNTV